MTDEEIKEKVARKSDWYTNANLIDKKICNYHDIIYVDICKKCNDERRIDSDHEYFDPKDFITEKEIKEIAKKGMISASELFDLYFYTDNFIIKDKWLTEFMYADVKEV